MSMVLALETPSARKGGGKPPRHPAGYSALCFQETKKRISSSGKRNPRHCDGNVKAQVALVTCVCSFYKTKKPKKTKQKICSVPVLCIFSCILFILRSVGMDCMSVFYAGTMTTF